MTKILPVEAVRTGPPLAVAHRVAGRPSRARLAVLNVASRVTLRQLPKVPDRVKRLLLGGRTITIDGNTLDTTLQAMLALQRASRVGGLVDTVIDAGPMALAAGAGTGVQFAPVNTPMLENAIRRTASLRRDPAAWRRLQANGMASDVSWRQPARSAR